MPPVTGLLAQEAGEPNPFLPHAFEILMGLIAFAVLLYVLYRFAWPMLTRGHAQNVETLSDGLRRADQQQEEARSELERERERLAQVDGETARIRDDARADAERIKEDMATRASEESARILAQAEQTLEASRSRTVSDLRGEVGGRSVELARRIVAAQLADDASRRGSVDAFIDRLEAMGGGDGTTGIAGVRDGGNGSAPTTPTTPTTGSTA